MRVLARHGGPMVAWSAVMIFGGAVSAEELKVMSGTVGVQCDAKGLVTVLDKNGSPRLALGNYQLRWSPGETVGGAGALFTTADGKQGLRVNYWIKDDPSGKLKITGQFVPSNGVLKAHYDFEAPEGFNGKGAMLQLRGRAKPERKIVRLGVWQRDEKGGVPFEAPDAAGLYFSWPGEAALVRGHGTNLNWSVGPDLHLPARDVDGKLSADLDVVVAGFAAPPSGTSGILNNRALSIDLATEKAFNVWDKGGQPVALKVSLTNVASTTKSVTLIWWAKDFQGKVLSQGDKKIEVGPRSQWDGSVRVPLPETGMSFTEVLAESGDDKVFARTNLAVVPPHQFGPAEGNIFGMSAFFSLPSEDEALKMLQRLGVRWLRGSGRLGEVPLEKLTNLGIRQNYSRGFLPTDATYKDAAYTRDWLKSQFGVAAARQAPVWEVGNEWNMVGGVGKGTYGKQYAEQVLKPVSALRTELKSPIKIMSQGLAGGDPAFIDEVYKAGGWNDFDVFGLHPGRGNFTPDYLGVPDEPGKEYEYWNFLGTIRRVKEKLAKYGDKPIILTEGYACTRPNAMWNDSYRHAAENVVLSYALALSEGIQEMDWYQFNDSVWFNQGGVNFTDPEYHFGIVNRDLSLKPSALAYRAAAIALDGARFVKWLEFPGTKNRGLLFDTPRGQLTVLWNRADGYYLNRDRVTEGKHYAQPEAWVDDWKTKTNLTVKARGTVREIDCLGQERTLRAKGGLVEVTLDGAPRMYYGLELG